MSVSTDLFGGVCLRFNADISSQQRRVGLLARGEEDQHEERCLDCGATRIVCDWVEYPDKTGTSYEKWHTPTRQ